MTNIFGYEVDAIYKLNNIDIEKYKKLNCNKRKLYVHGAEHVKSSKIAEKEYWNTIYDFLMENL